MNAKTAVPWARIWLVFGVGLAAAAPTPALAVSTSISATASQSGSFVSDTIAPNARTVVASLLASDSFTTSSVTVPKSHAKAFATAKVNTITGVVTKATGGLGWVDSPASNDPRANAWSSYASGTQLIANGAGGTVPIQFFIPGTANGVIPDADYGVPPPQASEPASLTLSKQSLLSNSNNMPTVPSFFDVFIELHASVHQGPIDQELFNGTLTFQPGTAPVPTGDFANVTLIFPPGGGDGTFHVDFADYLGPTVDLVSNTPFDLIMDLYMTAGGPHGAPGPGAGLPPLALPPGATFAGQTDAIGSGGSFLAAVRILDETHQLAVVPEPSSLVLLCLGGLSWVAMAIRRRRRAG